MQEEYAPESSQSKEYMPMDALPPRVRAFQEAQLAQYLDQLHVIKATDYDQAFELFQSKQIEKQEYEKLVSLLKKIAKTAETGRAAIDWESYECVDTLRQKTEIGREKVNAIMFIEFDARILSLGVFSDRYVVSSADGGNVNIWDLQQKTSREINGFKGQMRSVCAVGKDRVALLRGDGAAFIVSLSRPNYDFTLTPPDTDFTYGLFALNDSELLINRKGIYEVWDVDKKIKTLTKDLSGGVIEKVFENGAIFTNNPVEEHCSLRVITRDGDILFQRTDFIRSTSEISYVDEFVDGRVIYGGYDFLSVWDLKTNTQRDCTFNFPVNIRCMKVLPDGNIVISNGITGDVQIIDISQDPVTVVRTLTGKHTKPLINIEVFSDGRIATAGEDMIVNIWGPKK